MKHGLTNTIRIKDIANIHNINIGTGEIWNFLDYTVNRKIVNLLEYSINNKFFNDNIAQNYVEGRHYDDKDLSVIKTKYISPAIKEEDMDIDTYISYTEKEKIGDVYRVDKPNLLFRPSLKRDLMSDYKREELEELIKKDTGYSGYTVTPFTDIFKESNIKKQFDDNKNKILSPDNTTISKTKLFQKEIIDENKKYKKENIEGKNITVTKNNRNTVVNYNYHQETEVSGNVQSFRTTNLIDNTTVGYLNTTSNTLISRTNKLFQEKKIGSLINRFHTDKVLTDSELITAYDKEYGLSRGRNLLKKNQEKADESGYNNPYCRVWTAHHQYSHLKDRIRPFVDENGQAISIGDTQSNYGNLRPNEGAKRLNDYSVLKSDGFVRMSSTYGENKEFSNIKNYMFSIENLAWKDIITNSENESVSKEQRGPNNGRIMWFPPYNLRFSENINVNWNANTFIGRGEEIYTYTNTVRTGTLDFTLLIDHPSILNKWHGANSSSIESNKNKLEQDLLRFFAGCDNLNNDVSIETQNKEIEKDGELGLYGLQNLQPNDKRKVKQVAYFMLFPNNYTGRDDKQNINNIAKEICYYNTGQETDLNTTKDKIYEHHKLKPDNDYSESISWTKHKERIKKTLFNDYSKIEFYNIDDLVNNHVHHSEISNEYFHGINITNASFKFTYKGFASSHGQEEWNKDLSKTRGQIMETFIKEYITKNYDEDKIESIHEEGRIININEIKGEEDVNNIEAKIARAAYVIIDVYIDDSKTNLKDSDTNSYSFNVMSTSGISDTKQKITSLTYYNENDYTYDNEYLYFSEVMGNKMVYKNIIDKVKYFNPAFHSITPEGFNSRLTFLHQCTRQGPTNAVTSGRVNKESDNYLKFAGNLSFGRAPYCVLRIGDFFNTKICIDSMSVNYDNNGIQWDLNPEGVGVQPMFANISLSFKFLGGQDIAGPIERLQNAVTSNYYANASIYDRHADTNTSYYDATTNERILK